jgi:hypothetical protein
LSKILPKFASLKNPVESIWWYNSNCC